jgi:sugar phosphate isomerase/epimerase
MKLSVSNLFWSNKQSVNLFYKKLQELNIRYIEIAPTKLFDDFPKVNSRLIKNEIDELKNYYNLEIIAMQSIWFGISNNMFSHPQERVFLLNKTKEIIEFSNSINCKKIIFGNPKQRNGYSTNFEFETITFFRLIGDYCKNFNIEFLIEPNPSIYNTNFLNNNHKTIEFIKKINHPNISLNLDWGSMIYNNETIDELIPNKNLIKHIHISEPFLKPILQRNIHKEITKLNVNTFLTIETLNIDDLDLLDKMVKYLRGIIKFE